MTQFMEVTGILSVSGYSQSDLHRMGSDRSQRRAPCCLLRAWLMLCSEEDSVNIYGIT